jgi:hypothetical protein
VTTYPSRPAGRQTGSRPVPVDNAHVSPIRAHDPSMRFHGIASIARLARWNALGLDRNATHMIIYALVAAAFVIGIVVGGIVLLRAGIAREERDRSMLGVPATRASGVTRRMVGLYVRAPRYAIVADQATAGREAEPRSAGHPCTMGHD